MVYLVLAAYGWWSWLYAGEVHGYLRDSRTTPAEWTALAAVGLVAVVALWVVLEHITDSTMAVGDAATTVLSLAATWGQRRKKVESWWLWIAADIVYVPLYASKGLWLTGVLYLVFLALCVKGLLAWRADLAAPDAAVALPVGSRP